MECIDHMFYVELIICIICIHIITLGSPCKRHEVLVRVGRTRIAKQEVLFKVERTRIGKKGVMARVGRTQIVMHARLPRGMSALDRELACILVGLDLWIDIDSKRAGYMGCIEEMCNHSSSDSDPQEEYSPLSVEEYLPQPVEDHSPSSNDFDPQEEYSPLSVEEYLPQPAEDHSASSDDFDPQEENSQLPVEEFLPSLVEDDSSLLDNSNPQEEYSPMSVEEYSPQLVEDYSPLLDEMSIEENTIEEYTPGTLEDDESQQSPRIEMDEEYIEGYRNFEKLLTEFINKLEGHQMDFNTSFYEQLLSFGDLIVSEWPWSDGGIEYIWKEITHTLLKVLLEEL
ncbi:hypothetical protein LWI29_023904 [Acer saccharum]|uniref:Uncharacterized protein n=1 Tax=Acer saccharum TaxID=4024 RepID=A0AA39S486_ACESA|nr:hypothetical protein LWI29_023904 [Acer saccharum]